MRFRGFTRVDTDKLQEIRAKLTVAFKSLRKQKLVARRNFMCCGSCASAALESVCEAKPEILGAVYYTQQAAADFNNGASVYLNYGGVKGRATDEEIGKLVSIALKAAGVEFEWDGNPSACIKVKGSNR
jgi:hypothetical protein